MADAVLTTGTFNLSRCRRMLIPKNPVPLPVRGITTRGRLTVLPLTRMLRLSSLDTMMSMVGCSTSFGSIVSGQASNRRSVSYLVELAFFCSITHNVSFNFHSWIMGYRQTMTPSPLSVQMIISPSGVTTVVVSAHAMVIIDSINQLTATISKPIFAFIS